MFCVGIKIRLLLNVPRNVRTKYLLCLVTHLLPILKNSTMALQIRNEKVAL
jgi:hypothetical protein